MIKYNVHNVFQGESPERLKELSGKFALPVQLMLFNLEGHQNIAVAIRSAAVLGCSDVWVIGKRKYDGRPEVGSHNYINVHKQLDFDVSYFEKNGIQPIVVEQGGMPIEEMNFKPYMKQPVCFIMGSESTGIPKGFLESAPRVTISQYGMVRSLNVSMAATIVMYEYLRQWRKMRI